MCIQTIDDFIRNEISVPFEWSKSDCCSTADKWIFSQTGHSPLDDYGRRPTAEWTKRDGIIKACLKVLHDFEKTKEPQTGDVGIIVYNKNVAGMAIKKDDLWFTKSENGSFLIKPDRIIVAWKVKCRNS